MSLRLSVSTVSEVMITEPKTTPAEATIGDVRAAFVNDHVHMVLLTKDGVLRGTLLRDDLPDAASDERAALELAHLEGRTVAPHVPIDVARRRLEAHAQRRLAVVDDSGRLVGLVCLKRDRTGFCTLSTRAMAGGPPVTDPSVC